MGHEQGKDFALDVTIPEEKSGVKNQFEDHDQDSDDSDQEDDFYNYSYDDSGITPLSKLNGTSVTIADVLLHEEKLLVGDDTFTKRCEE